MGLPPSPAGGGPSSGDPPRPAVSETEAGAGGALSFRFCLGVTFAVAREGALVPSAFDADTVKLTGWPSSRASTVTYPDFSNVAAATVTFVPPEDATV